MPWSRLTESGSTTPLAFRTTFCLGDWFMAGLVARARLEPLSREIVDELGLRRRIVDVGLGYHVGVGGARLSAIQRQKLAIARSVIKRPELLVVDEATGCVGRASASENYAKFTWALSVDQHILGFAQAAPGGTLLIPA